MFVSRVEIQATVLEIILSQVLKVSLTIPQLRPVAQINRVPLLVSPVGQHPNSLYTLQSRQNQENSPNIVSSTLYIFHLHIYVLLDLGTSLSFVTPYIVVNFGVSPKILVDPSSVSTQMGKSIIARRVYRNCPIMIS